jgi:rhamnosyltransferase subunit B
VLPPWSRWFAASGRRLALLQRLNDLRRRRGWAASPEMPPDHPIARLREEVGLPRLRQFRPQPRLALCMWPEWFASPQPDWPKEALVTGFPFHPPPRLPAKEREVTVAADAPIVVTTGTVAGSQFAFYQTAVDACVAIGRPAVLVSPHRNHIPSSLPPTVTWVPHAPFSELFPKASLVLHHGGIGTVAYAMAAGVPQIVLPMRWDQFDSGNRLQRLGTGRMLSPRETPSAALRDAMLTMLGSARVAARCRFWQSKVDVQGAVMKASDAIEARC